MASPAQPSRPTWDPAQYTRFEREREQPFLDLVARVPDGAVRSAADLGCGTGSGARRLATRWSEARVTGVDSSPEMLRKAQVQPLPANLRFVEADLATWEPEAPLDRIVSNAALHWLPDHARLLAALADRLAPGGVLAVQMPANDRAPSHAAFAELAREPAWREKLRGAVRDPLAAAEWYAERLAELGLEADVWETTYYHRLARASDVVEWTKGTTLRPALSQLEPRDADALLAEYAARIERAYPAGPRGVLFPFKRLFFVATQRR